MPTTCVSFLIACAPTAHDALSTSGQHDDAVRTQSGDSAGAAAPVPVRESEANAVPRVSDVKDLGECFELRAHGEQRAGDDSSFEVPSGESYQCFHFRSPFAEGDQGVAIEALVRADAGLHHMLLYDLHQARPDGSFESCIGRHENAAVLSGWAPGAHDTVFPQDVGMRLPAGEDGYFLLEMHYINFDDAAVSDRSGLRICAAKAPRSHTASITWLGTENIGGPIGIPPGKSMTVGGTCTPGRAGLDDDAPIHLMLALPHMHERGRRVELLVHRAHGEVETLLDEAFDADRQLGHTLGVDIGAGDTLETRCSFENLSDLYVPYGAGAAQEMCYVFTLAYPAGALDNPSVSWAGARNTCFL